MNNVVSRHYDMLIDENNDPVHDPLPLKEYMDKWDGTDFIEKMNISREDDVLEIGIGTGRLAVRVADRCKKLCGVDISPKTIEKAKENLSAYKNVELICDDFLQADFETTFDVIYSSLTFMHIREKNTAFEKISKILKKDGRFLLSIDKNRDGYIDMASRKIKVYPDSPEKIEKYARSAKLKIDEMYETEFAHIFVILHESHI